MMPLRNRYFQQAGFTLIEIAMVLLIMGLLLMGLVPSISGIMDRKYRQETFDQLDKIQQELLGFAIANGRLPCPASPTSNGQESFCSSASGASDTCTSTSTTVTQTHGKCSHFHNGFVPSATLGITTFSNLGFVEDAWGNRIRYAVTSYSPGGEYVFTATNGMRKRGTNDLEPNLLVCSTATGITSSSCGSGNINGLTSNPGVPLIIFSTGRNGGLGGAGIDEAANLNGDRLFVSHTPAVASSPNGEFDDLAIWLSENVLVERLVSARKL